MDSQRCWVWLAVMASAGACERCTWHLDAVEVAGVTMPGSTSGTQGYGAGTWISGAEGTGDDSGAEGTGSVSSSGEMPSTGASLATSGDLSCPGAECTGTSGGDESGPGGLATPYCGDGKVDPGEACDDGDRDNTDACTNECTVAKCGDGYHYLGVEECDDGADGDMDECTDDCWAPRIVFVTSDVYPGDFDGFGGIKAADKHCANAASAGGLPGKFQAWLSTQDLSPAKRFVDAEFNGWIVRTDGKKVARGWSGLAEPMLLNAIYADQTGSPLFLMPVYVWTNTRSDGYPASGEDCSAWSENGSMGAVGRFINVDKGWTDSTDYPCNEEAHLYCFQVDSGLF